MKPDKNRVPFGGGIGAGEHHSESPESLFAHIPGLKVVSISNAVDAYWGIQQAIKSDDPSLFFEPKRLYHSGALRAEIDTDGTPARVFSSQVVREGTTATVVAYGPSVKVALDAAAAAGDEGKSLGVQSHIHIYEPKRL